MGDLQEVNAEDQTRGYLLLHHIRRFYVARHSLQINCRRSQVIPFRVIYAGYRVLSFVVACTQLCEILVSKFVRSLHARIVEFMYYAYHRFSG